MAGLLDIFGTSGQNTLGLLGGDVGSARDDAQAQALYALAGSLLSGGPTGLSIVRGLQQGQQAYKQAMRGALEEQLQGVQVADLLRKRKLEEEALARQQMIDRAVARAYQPGAAAQPAQFYGQETQMPLMDEEGNLMPGASLPVQAQAPKLDIQGIAPALMASREGRATLADLMKTQEAMQPKYQAVGDVLYQLGLEGPKAVAGAPKGPVSLQEFQAALQNPAYAAFLEKKEALKAPKVAVDLKDPTAIAKAQQQLIGDWRGVVKDVGAMEVADRFKAAQAAVQQGNAGNKAADGALIYAIGKIYDPSGAVQEGDKKTILGNRNIPDTVKAYAQRVFESGADLLPTERSGLLEVATKVVQQKAMNLEAQKAPYVSISRQLGGSGDLLLNPLADILNQSQSNAATGDLASQARAILEKRKKGQ